jgi:hypothetical protein
VDWWAAVAFALHVAGWRVASVKVCSVLWGMKTKAYFAQNLNLMNSTAFVLFGKYCSIVDQLGSKDSSRDFQLNCVISYFFTYI